ncbi:hypothetical protein FIBSPDRAFT_893648 [Athelia psychrophila]|uniref:Uncharacterized protein n=1 Tax=Athelia psychrophila TaxID=1759441 RepID=A0A166GZ68_9AGAM|nr:hypothetical protein FIBSPDRAFT_893648 [Fibularhizoctonia sp. CBS 109695]
MSQGLAGAVSGGAVIRFFLASPGPAGAALAMLNVGIWTHRATPQSNRFKLHRLIASADPDSRWRMRSIMPIEWVIDHAFMDHGRYCNANDMADDSVLEVLASSSSSMYGWSKALRKKHTNQGFRLMRFQNVSAILRMAVRQQTPEHYIHN